MISCLTAALPLAALDMLPQNREMEMANSISFSISYPIRLMVPYPSGVFLLAVLEKRSNNALSPSHVYLSLPATPPAPGARALLGRALLSQAFPSLKALAPGAAAPSAHSACASIPPCGLASGCKQRSQMGTPSKVD